MVFLKGSYPRVIAHRGLALDHPENTPGAFHAALAAGADILETDVHVSRDGVVVIAHDPDLTRVAGRQGLVSDFTADKLASIDLGSGQGFPTLNQVLTEFPTAKFNIDLKTRPAVEPFAEVIRAHKAEDRILATSFDEPTRQAVINLLPDVVSSTSQSQVIQARLRTWFGLPSDTWSIPPEVVALQIPPARWGFALVTPSMVRLAKRRGLEIHVWTINSPDDMKRLWQMGVHGIVTDRSDLAVEVRGELFPELSLG